MNAKEDYTTRCEMYKMHDEFIERMSDAYDNDFYIEAAWYCYAIIEQRISRLISKYIDRCVWIPDRTDEKSASISVRIKCLKKLITAKYWIFDQFDVDILDRVLKWCNDRNELVHGLISLKHYKKYDKEFEKLAKVGVPLVFELYDACTDLRNRWYECDEPNVDFPVKKCNCKKNKCINPSCI